VLTNDINHQNKHLKWIPHKLSSEQKSKRASSCLMMLEQFKVAKHQGWTYFVTCDESWFYLDNYHDSAWVPEEDPPPERPLQFICSEKVMITVFWNPRGFFLVESLPKGQKFNSTYYCNNILKQLAEISFESLGKTH